MRFAEDSYTVPSGELASRMAFLLPEYLPGIETGSATITDLRSCWIKSTRNLLETLGRQFQLQVHSEEPGEVNAKRQLRTYWKKGDAVALCAFTGWGDRDELERAFGWLRLLKAPQKAIVYTCARWQEAVLDQLSAALLRYPHHVEGEEYLALNIVGAEGKLFAHSVRAVHSGSLTLPEASLTPVPGSPFAFGKGRAAGTASRT